MGALDGEAVNISQIPTNDRPVVLKQFKSLHNNKKQQLDESNYNCEVGEENGNDGRVPRSMQPGDYSMPQKMTLGDVRQGRGRLQQNKGGSDSSRAVT